MSVSREPILAVRDLTVRFGGIVALDGVSFDVAEGQIVGLIGPNGAGKTTLFNCLSRLYTPQQGDVRFRGRSLLALPPHRIADLGIGRTFQNLALFPTLTVLQNVMIGVHSRTRSDFLSNALRLPWVGREEAEIRERARELLAFLDLTAVAAHPAAGLPFGTLKRVELARPRRRARAAPGRRAGGRPEPRGGRRAGGAAAHDPRAARRHHPARRAPHGARHADLRQCRRSRLRTQDRRGPARPGAA